MSELEFTNYWWVYLKRNPKWDRKNKEQADLMEGHFEFIDEQIKAGNLYVAIPMEPSGGQYYFDGDLTDKEINNLLENEPSIGTVFKYELKVAKIPANHLLFTLEAKKKVDQFHKERSRAVS